MILGVPRWILPMPQNFLLSAAARSLSLAQVMALSDAEAEVLFARIRWPQTQGLPVCPTCGGCNAYDCRRAHGAPRWRCKACGADFSLTSGTLFAFHKLPLRIYLAATLLFVNEVKGKNALALSRDLGVQYKTAFVLAHKIREAVASEIKNVRVGGAGRDVEIDGCYIGGYVRPENRKADRQDRRLTDNQSGKRQVVVAVRERPLDGVLLGRTITSVFKSEDAAIDFIKARVDRASTVHADEATGWNALHARFDTKRINHSVEYANDEACTNQAESYFSRLRRAELGHHHHLAGSYLARYSCEIAWREDHRSDSNGRQFRTALSLIAANKPSVDFCGYWQRNQAA
jgi:transposase-like protein